MAPNSVELFVPFVNGYGGAALVLGPVNIPPVVRGKSELDGVTVRVILVVELVVSVEFAEGP